MLGHAAWLLWGTGPASAAVAVAALLMQPLWNLHGQTGRVPAPWAKAAAGGGSIGGVLRWAVRGGFFAAVRAGLGGRFGGGGASSQD